MLQQTPDDARSRPVSQDELVRLIEIERRMKGASKSAELIAGLIEHLGSELAALANVPISQRDQFADALRRALLRWYWDIIFQSQSQSAHPDRALRLLLQSADKLRAQLDVVLHFVSTNQSLLAFNVFAKLQDAIAQMEAPSIDKILGDLDRFSIAIEYTLFFGRTRSRGPAPGIPGYPGLDALVFNLASAAYRTGGRFTAHRKSGAKGTLLDALDELRAHLLHTNVGRLLAEFLPDLDRHPVRSYERLLKAARSSRVAPFSAAAR